MICFLAASSAAAAIDARVLLSRRGFTAALHSV